MKIRHPGRRMKQAVDMEAGTEMEPEADMEAGMEMEQSVAMDTEMEQAVAMDTEMELEIDMEMEPEEGRAFREAARISGTDNLTAGGPSLLRYMNLQFQ